MRQTKLSCLLLVLILSCGVKAQDTRIVNAFLKYSIAYLVDNAHDIPMYQKLFDVGVNQAENFFGEPFMKTFVVNLHPNRASLDRQWQNDWKMPGFKSECWMVASGISTQLDIIAPTKWKTEACEHDVLDSLATQRLVAHEMVHVFHGQHNPSGDFSEVEKLDWFVEGLATYASGQLTDTKMNEISQLVKSGSAPTTVDDFWKGKSRYSLSGSAVKYLDMNYGRQVIINLLRAKSKAELFSTLQTDEVAFVQGWKAFILSDEQKK
ncbi:MAG TPA: collagenase [Chryseosolibacter sp.]